jgi:formate dehydrogenase iron-sulfur subunit
MVACPFSIPKFQWEETLPCICKCTFCADRQAEGMQPACSDVCPTGALTFGDREELIAEARQRIADQPGEYVDQIYGDDEVGGTSILYLSPVPFEELGFAEVGDEPVTALSEAVATYGTVGVAVGVAGLLGTIHQHAGTHGHEDEPAQRHDEPDEVAE